MKREKLKSFVQHQIDIIEKKPYDYWIAQEFPIVSEEEFDGVMITIEIELLELTDTYAHLVLEAYCDGFSSWFPVYKGALIYK